MLVTSFELSASTADAVLEFSVLVVFKLFFCEDQSLLILTSKLDHFFTRASWAAAMASILDNQLFPFIAEKFDQRCGDEKLRVLSSLKTCVFFLICKPLAS